MSTLDIPLSDDLRRFVDERARQMHHASPTDYVRALIRLQIQGSAAFTSSISADAFDAIFCSTCCAATRC